MIMAEGVEQKDSQTETVQKGENIQMCKMSIYIHSASQTPAHKYNTHSASQTPAHSLPHLQDLDEYRDFTGRRQKKENYCCGLVLLMLLLV